MQFKDIKDIVDNHKKMPKEAKPYEWLTYYQLKEYEAVRMQNPPIRTPQQLEERFKQIRQDYAVNMGAFERGESAVKRISDFFLKVEFACNTYKTNPNRQNADELWRVASNLSHLEEDEELNHDFIE